MIWSASDLRGVCVSATANSALPVARLKMALLSLTGLRSLHWIHIGKLSVLSFIWILKVRVFEKGF